MAKNRLLSKTLFVFICISLISSVFSRITPKNSKTTILNVSELIQNAKMVVSRDPDNLKTFRQQEQSIRSSSSSSSSSSSLTLELHSRLSLHKPTNGEDYKSLILAQLKRDSERVKSLNLRLDLAIRGISESDLKPVEVELEEQQVGNLEGPIISGTSQGSGEYFSRVGIGSPPKSVYMVLDTGSDVNWVQCEPCGDCYQQADPVFDPTESSSFKPLTCESQYCKSLDVSECQNGTCLYEVSYGDGSYTVGDFVGETLTFTGSKAVDNVAIGCGHNNEGLFIAAAGLLGLGGGSLSLPSQINTTSFSYCLVDRDSDSASTLEFGGQPALPPNSVTAPLLRNIQLDTFYYIGLTGISVGGDMLSIPPSSFEMDESGNGGIIIDSGTAVTRLQTDVYDTLRDAFVSGTRDLPSANGVALFDTCYDLSSKTSVEVPTVSFHFPEGRTLAFPAKNYLIPVDSVGTFCFAFAPTSSALSIIGNVQQQGTRVSLDLANSLVGLSPNKC
ncbi:Xylanase inhibitor, C-terminal [Dillenia turbinata]|uniref:Xylanase inhibitor, C-terminal n=1 Tax=Dillenia turbinata TaxID=194707 RepID=A0AAN8ZF31_9MAGN